MLADLLKIKTLRADRAEQHMRFCRSEAMRALDERQRAEQERDAFQRFRDHEEHERFHALIGRCVKLHDIEGVRDYLSLLREQLSARQQEADERTKAHQQASEVARLAEGAFHLADRAREKMLELTANHDAETARLLECKEEQEVEELVESMRDQEEWDGLAAD